MLELKNIKKEYPAGNGKVEALRGVSLAFRDSEFVSILGPSGCGKTTMLNIIGGLDKYTTGDLVINGRSTKDFKDRDWDGYRNHSVGFVFQSYNLIPHQSVLQNVELALSLSGVSKAERKKRAVAALERVGLGDQLKKRPGEMSGGQMQRVAIARAIVNDPDIILADEPTGALDSETSVQVMEILKEISADRLVVMVTHNPELAEKYSTRIVRMLDGEIKSDSAPITEEELKKSEKTAETANKKKDKKPSLSFFTSFGLSLNNLFTKKGRTALTSFAGSIGIIGIALIYAVSQGMTTYIDTVQEDTLSSYPLTLEAQHTDLGSLMESFMNAATASGDHEKDAVYQKTALYDLVNAMTSMETKENDLGAFKAYLENKLKSESEEDAKLKEAVSGVQYTYNTDLIVYTESPDGDIILSDSQELIRKILAKSFSSMGMADMTAANQSSPMASMMGGAGTSFIMWQEMLTGTDGSLINPVLEKQYELVYGSWPNGYDEIVLVLDENNEIDDMTLYALGLKSEAEIDEIVEAAMNRTELKNVQKHWSYEEICAMEFCTVIGADCYKYDEKTGTYSDLRATEAGLRYLYDNGLKLKVVGIIRPNEDAVASMLTGSIGYTKALTEYIIEKTADSPAVLSQLKDKGTDILTGLPFRDNSALSAEKKADDFKNYVSTLSEKEKADAYISIMSIPSKEQLDGAVSGAMQNMTRKDMESALLMGLTEQTGMSESELGEYVAEMTDEDLTELFEQIIAEQVKAQFASAAQAQLGSMPSMQLAMALDMAIPTYTVEQCAEYYDAVLEFSPSSYEVNVRKLGYVDINVPSTVNLFAATFEQKDDIEAAIAKYNDGVEETQKISYTDYVGLMMSSVTTIINAITYVLIAFVAVSLIVSSIMIGVVTLISVQERTKEIGILRAIGASKKNVSGMFNSETVIIGFTSGLIGVLTTYLLCIPINLILHHLTGINNLSAQLPIPVAAILVAISVLLTLISGIIPSRSAAKKDPVVALRTE